MIATSASQSGEFAELVQLNRPELLWTVAYSQGEVTLTLADIAVFRDRIEQTGPE